MKEAIESVYVHPIWTAVCLLISFLISLYLSDLYAWYHLPPGPFPLPFVGNTLSIPREKFWLTIEDWSKIYGSIYTIWIGRKPCIMVSDPAIAAELLCRRGGKYSSRTRNIVFGELFTGNSSMAVMPYGQQWAIVRKLLHNSLKPTVLPAYKPRQEAEAVSLAADILANGKCFSGGFDRFAATVVFSIAYGRRIDSLDSKVLAKRKYYFSMANTFIAPGAYLVESLPFLLHLPGFLSRWKEHPLQMGRENADFDNSLVDAIRKDLEEKRGSSVANLTETMIGLQAKGEAGTETLDERHFSALPAVIFGAGFDTSASTLHTAVLALLLNLHVQRIAHAEIDTVVGRDRTPTFADQVQLPYINALVKEVLRWRPAAVYGLPHSITEDDVYDGFRFAKGMTIWATAWGVNRNEEYFPSPETFTPERYLEASDPRYDAKVAVRPFPGPYGHATFGWGRRLCVGADLAANSIFIVLAKLIWGFEMKPVEGEVYDVDNFVGGIIIKPAPFKCDFVVRGEHVGVVLEKEMKEAQKIFEIIGAWD